MIGASIVFFQTSYIIPQAILLIRGRNNVLPPRAFSLGRWGVWFNGVSVAFVIFMDVIYCFPTTLPATAANMSYVSVVFIGITGFIMALWFTTKHKTFKGPYVNNELIRIRREQALHSETVHGVEAHYPEKSDDFTNSQVTAEVSEGKTLQ